MERFLEPASQRSRSVTKHRPTGMHKMAGEEVEEGGGRHRSPSPSTPDLQHSQPMQPAELTGRNPHTEHAQIAAAVALLLKPMISEAVENAIQHGLNKIQKELSTQTKALKEAEQRIACLEDDLLDTQTRLSDMESLNKTIQSKLDDLENRSRRNNLRIIGLPESYKPQQLETICAQSIPEALGLDSSCIVERAHRLGPPQDNRTTPRPVIVKYLNYKDRSNILQSFRSAGSLTWKGEKLLIFADYSAEVTKKRKAFSSVCSRLYEKNIRFTLAYPATLHINAPSGRRFSFQDPRDASRFMDNLEESDPRTSPLRDASPPGTPVQPRKSARPVSYATAVSENSPLPQRAKISSSKSPRKALKALKQFRNTPKRNKLRNRDDG